MLVERLIARIRGQLDLPTPDLEARSLAGEYAALCQRARERLEQCATLVKSGNEHAAFQAAEAEPDLLDLCAELSFAESDRWHSLCRERGLPTGFPIDIQHFQIVENLYGRTISESHPLYRDYRDAIRKRDEDRALSVLRSIMRINPEDPNVRSELTRLSAKFLRESLGKVTTLFSSGNVAEAVDLMARMERFGTHDLSEEPQWQAALAQRVEWLRIKANEQAHTLLASAQEAHTNGQWEICAGDLGRVRALERDHRLKFSAKQIQSITDLESWAGALATESEIEAHHRAAVSDLKLELEQFRRDADRGAAHTLLIVKLGTWLERAQAYTERLPEGLLKEASTLRDNIRSRVNRRYMALTSVWVLGLLVTIGGLFYWNTTKQQEEESLSHLAEATRLLKLNDYNGAQAALDVFEHGGTTESERTTRQTQAKPLREQLAALFALEQKLTLEARHLQERRRQGLTPNNLTESKSKASSYLAEYTVAGHSLRQQLDGLFPEPTAFLAACNAELDRLRQELDTQSATLTKAIGDGISIADSAAAVAALDRLRLILNTLTDAHAKDLDSALALADRAELRLAGERKIARALESLRSASDLASYLSILANAAAELASEKSDLSARASFVFAQAPTLRALPRTALAPRTGAMWDAALEADSSGLFLPSSLTEPEQTIVQKLSDSALLDTMHKATLSLYSKRGVTIGRTIYLIGEITETRTNITDGVQITQRAKELTRDGSTSENLWRRHEFANGLRIGEELTGVKDIPELAALRNLMRFSDSKSGKLLEPPLRTMSRIRRSDSDSQELRAYQLQEFFRLSAERPAAWGLLFSPSALRDAEALRRITQYEMRPFDFLFKDKWVHAKNELTLYFASQSEVDYAEEARFWRSTFANLRTRKLIFSGMVLRDGKASLREPLRNTVLFGLDIQGKPSVLFRIDEQGELQRLADAAPLSPLLNYSGTVSESAKSAGIPPKLSIPEGGWEALLQGRDL